MSDDSFCEFVGKTFNLKHVNIIENQVHVGDGNIIDILCAGLDDDENENFIVVELKYRAIEPKDLAQLGRYVSALIKIWGTDKPCNIKGLLVGSHITEEMGHIINAQLLDDETKIAVAETKLVYHKTDDVWYDEIVDVRGSVSKCLNKITEK